MELEVVWTSIIIPIIIGPLFLLVKYLWDRYNNHIQIKKDIEFNEKLNNIKVKLSKFYWPVYIKLISIYQLNYNLPYFDEELVSSSSSNYSSDEENFIKFTNKKNKICGCYYTNKEGKTKRCKNKIPYNSFNNICRTCRWKTLTDTIHLITTNQTIKENDTSIIEPEIIPEPEPENQLNFEEIDNIVINIDNIVNIKKDVVDDDSLTGHGIGVVKELPKLNLNIDETTAKKLKLYIKQLYQEIIGIINDNISTAEPRTRIGRQLTKFIKYATIYNITYDTNYKFTDFGTKDNTNKLLGLVEIKLFDLQKEYHYMIEKGPFDL